MYSIAERVDNLSSNKADRPLVNSPEPAYLEVYFSVKLITFQAGHR